MPALSRPGPAAVHRPAPDRRAALAALLAAHAPADPAEAAHRERMLALAAAAGDPFARDRFAPGHFTASAFVLSPDGASLLLIYHRRLERWLQPGGHIDPGDVDIFAAARRELAEETGVDGLDAPGGPRLFDLDVHPIPARPGERAHEHFDVRVLFRAAAVALRPASDARDVRWARLDELEGLGADASVRRAAAKLVRAGAA